MPHLQLQTREPRESRTKPAPGGWGELVVTLVQAYPRRVALAVLFGILGLTLDVSCEADYVPLPEGQIAAARAGQPGFAPVTPRAAPPAVDPDTLRVELGTLPGTGHAGVTRLLDRYAVTRDRPQLEREFAAHVRTALGGADPGERLGAVRVLTRLGPAAGAEDLISLSRDPEEEIRLTALRGLGRMQGAGVEPAMARLQQVAAEPSADREERFQAIQSLSRIRVLVDVDFVAGMAAREPDPLIRLIAARTLLSHRDERALPLLVDLLGPEIGDDCTDEELAFVRREVSDALRTVAPRKPAEETQAGWRQVLPSISTALGAADFAYVPSTLYPPR